MEPVICMEELLELVEKGGADVTSLSELAEHDKGITKQLARANCLCTGLTHAQVSYNKMKVAVCHACKYLYLVRSCVM